MKRKISDQYVETIKKMIAKGHSNKYIREHLWIKHGKNISSGQLNEIKKGEAYRDVREDLNEEVFAQYQSRKVIDIQLISDIKWALAEGYSDTEILKAYKISKTKLRTIKMLYAPYRNIASQYNDAIYSNWKRRKKTNIDKQLVIKIKKEYVTSNGQLNLTKTADSLNIDKATVSCILNLKAYREHGRSYNNKILSINKNIAKEKKEKERLENIRKNTQREINDLRNKKLKINNLIKKKQAELQKETP
ncbi:MAG: hypothetical protein ACOCQ4_01160 [bacterium]